MIIAELIYPYDIRTREKTCAACELRYSKKEYSVLFDSYKLGYFKVHSDEFPICSADICHDCLFDYVAVDTEDDSEFLNFKILTKENEYNFEFEPQDEDDEFMAAFEEAQEDAMEDGVLPEGETGLEAFLKTIISEE